FTPADVSTLTTSALSLAAGATFNLAINGMAAYSVLTSATVDLGGATLVIGGTFVPASGQIFTIVNNTGSQAIGGTFAGLPDSAIIPHILGTAYSAAISYVGGDGN